MPLVGAWVADQYLGRFNTIMWSIAIALLGHSVLVISAIPSVIDNSKGAIACFAIGLVIMGVGTGGFKYAPPLPCLDIGLGLTVPIDQISPFSSPNSTRMISLTSRPLRMVNG